MSSRLFIMQHEIHQQIRAGDGEFDSNGAKVGIFANFEYMSYTYIKKTIHGDEKVNTSIAQLLDEILENRVKDYANIGSLESVEIKAHIATQMLCSLLDTLRAAGVISDEDIRKIIGSQAPGDLKYVGK